MIRNTDELRSKIIGTYIIYAALACIVFIGLYWFLSACSKEETLTATEHYMKTTEFQAEVDRLVESYPVEINTSQTDFKAVYANGVEYNLTADVDTETSTCSLSNVNITMDNIDKYIVVFFDKLDEENVNYLKNALSNSNEATLEVDSITYTIKHTDNYIMFTMS